MNDKVETIGIMIEVWKLPIFSKQLVTAGYAYTQHEGLTSDTYLLKVKTTNKQALAQVILKCQQEAARSKARKS